MSGPYVPKLNDQKASTWELNYKYTFFLSGEVLKHQTHKLKIPVQGVNTLCPIQSNKQYRSQTQKNSTQHPSYMTGTSEGVLLHKQLLKECQNTSKLIQISNLMTQKLQKRKENLQRTTNTTPKRRKDQEMSPLTLRRAYLPRRNTRPPAAHQAAAPAAAAPQKKHPQTPHSPKEKPILYGTTNRTHRVKLTLFKPGFEQETEEQLAQAFKRPVRNLKKTPIYPWLPSITPLVNFHLNFKG